MREFPRVELFVCTENSSENGKFLLEKCVYSCFVMVLVGINVDVF